MSDPECEAVMNGIAKLHSQLARRLAFDEWLYGRSVLRANADGTLERVPPEKWEMGR